MEDPIRIILDTDIGPDVDDVGALALLHILARKRPVQLLAVTHCTSNPWGCGCIDAVNTAYGLPDVPIGTWEDPGFLETNVVYNKYLAQNYPNRFQQAPCNQSAQAVLKDVLSAAPDQSVTLVTIGPLNNLGRLLSSPEGQALAKQKLKLVVAMALALEGPEWNGQMDIPAARTVFEVLERLAIPLVCTPSETGKPIITGRSWGNLPPEHPLPKAYALYSPQGRSSWDLTAVWYAIMGAEPLFVLSDPYRVKISDDGATPLTSDPQGSLRLLLNKKTPEEIGAYFDSLWEA